MLGIVRVATKENQAEVDRHGDRMTQFAGFQAVSASIRDQPYGIYDDATEADAVPKIVETAKWLAQVPGVDAISVSCAADPAVAEMRTALEIPVIAPGFVGATIARTIGTKIGVLGITKDVPEGIRHALGESLIAYRRSDSNTDTTSLSLPGAISRLTEKAAELESMGADVVLFACTGFSGIGLKAHLSGQIGIPIVDLVEAQAAAYMIIRGL